MYTCTIISHTAAERGVRLSVEHTRREELHGPALGVAEAAQHEPSVLLPAHHHVTVLADRAYSHHLTQCELLCLSVRVYVCVHVCECECMSVCV